MKKIIARAALLFCAVIPFPQKAETIDMIALQIVNGSPDLKAAALDNEALAVSLLTENNLPDPEVEGEYMIGPSGVKNRWGVGVSWGFDWFGSYSAVKRESDAKKTVADLRLEEQYRDSFIAIKQLLLDYILQDKQMKTLSGIISMTDSIYSISKKSMERKELTRLDINKLEIERAGLLARLAEVEDARETTLTALNVMAGIDCSSHLSKMVCEFPDIVVPDVIPELSSSVSVRAAMSEAEAAERGEKVAAMQSFPGVSIGYSHAFEDGTHFNGVQLGVSLPVFSSKNKKKAAKAATVAARYRAQVVKDKANQELVMETRRLKSILENLRNLSPVVNNVDNLELLQKAYSAKTITLLDYLNERNYFMEAVMNLFSLQYSAASSYLNIARLKY